MADTGLKVLADGFVFLEGPRWHNDRLWLSDMYGEAIYTISEKGEVNKIADVPNRPSGLGFLPNGQLVSVSMNDHRLYLVDENGKLEEYADLSSLVTGHINDAVVDDRGNIYVGNFGFDLMGGAEPALANLVRVDNNRHCTVAAEELFFPNGTVITPDGRTLICAESGASCLTAFDRAEDGTLSNRRVWAELNGQPDGACLDQEGAVWVAMQAACEFQRIAEGGEILQTIQSPGRLAIACNLGGSDGQTFFALTYEGELADIPSLAKNARIETCRVEVPGTGSP